MNADRTHGTESLTGHGNYFEDFVIGATYVHGRGRTVSNSDNLYLTLMTFNTAQAHFNLDYMQTMMDGEFSERLVMGGLTISLVVGLTSEDMAENAVEDLLYDDIRLHTPVYRGDTLYAESEVLSLGPSPDRGECGELEYRFHGWKGDRTTVATGRRRLLVKRRGSWHTP